jgi:hypothetical protein
MHTNCGDEIEACYGASYQSDDATGSLCESLWACSKNDCACGEDSCLITTCFGGATTDCQNCIPPISNCLTANCQAIADNCP